MKVYEAIAPRYMKKHLRRTLTLYLAITLSFTLVLSSWIIVKSVVESRFDTIKASHGGQDIAFTNLSKKQAKYIFSLNKDGKYIEEAAKAEVLGKGKTLKDKKKVKLVYLDMKKEYVEMHRYKLIKGKLPRITKGTDKEIAVEGWLLKKMELSSKPGQVIKLPIESDRGVSKLKRFKLTGVIKNIRGDKNNHRAYIIMRGGSIEPAKQQEYVSVVLKSGENPQKLIAQVKAEVNISGKNIIYNSRLINMKKPDSELNKNARLLMLAIMLIIVASGITIIYNMFNMSVADRIRELGILRCIGATVGQLRIVIFIESALLCILSVPAGMLLGVLTGNQLVQTAAKTTLGATGSVRVIIEPYMLWWSVVIIVVVVIASSINPAYQAGKVSPLGAVNNISGVLEGEGRREKKKRSLLNSMLGFIWDIKCEVAFQSMRKNRRRFFATIISMSIGVTLLSIFTYLNSSQHSKELVSATVRADYEFTYNRDIGVIGGLTENEVNRVRSFSCIKESFPSKITSGIAYMKKEKIGSEVMKTLNSSWGKRNVLMGKIKNNIFPISNTICSITDDKFDDMKEKVEGLNIKRSDFHNKNIALLYQSNLSMFPSKKYYKYKIGDKIKISLPQVYKGKLRKRYVVFTIGGYVYQGNYGVDGIWISENNFNKLTNIKGYQQLSAFLKDSYENSSKNKLESYFKKLEKENKNSLYDNYQDQLNRTQSYRENLLTLFNAMSMIILIVVIINILNTLGGNIGTRVREFGLLRTTGMTDGQVVAAAVIEVLMYCLISFAIGIGIGSVIVYLIDASSLGGYLYLCYSYIKPYDILFIFVITMVTGLLSLLLPLWKMLRLKPVDALRDFD